MHLRTFSPVTRNAGSNKPGNSKRFKHFTTEWHNDIMEITARRIPIWKLIGQDQKTDNHLEWP